MEKQYEKEFIHIHTKPNHCAVHQELAQHYKLTILQF